MAAMGISPQKKMNPRGTMVFLSSAICEWFLMFLLFIDATFSYILRRFSEYCELPTPCLFCSRSNTISGKRRKSGCYDALLCRSHMEEISSLVSCHLHDNIVDVREMCEDCFMPMHDKLNSVSYMVDKSGLEIQQHRVQSLLLHRQILLTSSGTRICKCCHKSWGDKPYSQRFLELTSVGKGASKANVRPPLPRVPGRSRFSRRNSFRKRRERLSAPATPRSVDMSHASYTELSYSSDLELAVPILDVKDGSFAVRGRNDMNLEHDYPHVTDTVLEKQSNHTSADITSVEEKEVSTTSVELPSASDSNKFEDITSVLQQSVPKQDDSHMSNITTRSDLISSKNTHRGSDNANQGTLGWILARQLVRGTGFANRSIPSVEKNEVSTKSVELPSSSDSIKFEVQQSVAKQDDSHMSSITTLADLISPKNTHPESDDANPGTLGMTLAKQFIKATGFSIGGVSSVEKKEVSTKFVELPSVSDSIKFEDIKSVLQKFVRKLDDSQNISSGASASTSSDANHVQDLASIMKLSESDDEGETSVDRKSVDDLYKELEEERNAASIAANQAMAMITRLQEEKAAVHMETLQYIRMMDEQAEYDMEALQRANDLLAEKEKELQDLEYELESYRDKTNEESPVLTPDKETISTTRKNRIEVLNPHKESSSTSTTRKNTTEVIDQHEESISTTTKNTIEILNPLKESIATTEVINPHNEIISTTGENTIEVLNPHEESINTARKHPTEYTNAGSVMIFPMSLQKYHKIIF